MNASSLLKIFAMVLCIFMVLSVVSSAPPVYEENENNIRELLDLLVQKENLEDRLGLHQVSRKASRSPQLRLRFGKRGDTGFPVAAYMAGMNDMEN